MAAAGAMHYQYRRAVAHCGVLAMRRRERSISLRKLANARPTRPAIKSAAMNRAA